MRARILLKIYYNVDIIFIYLHAKNQHHRSKRLGEMNPKPKKGNFHSKSPLRGSGPKYGHFVTDINKNLKKQCP